MRRSGCLALGGAVALVLAICVARALLARPRAIVVPPARTTELEPLSLSRRLAGALRIETVSSAEPDARELAAIEEMERYLERTFARAHAALARERPSDFALLYTWAGSEPALAPLVLLAHLDVVPVERATLDAWERPPFSGDLEAGFVWGRGALDDKSSAIAILEAIEHLLREGHRPRRTLLVAFGFDEEVGGERGARVVAELLERREVRPELVLDEGHFVLEGFVAGIERPVAAIGLAEKGALALELRTSAESGHASLPPASTAIGRLARALTRLEATPPPARIDGPAALFLERLLPDFPFARRLALANLWLAEPLVVAELAREPGTNALLCTTTAITYVQGGTGLHALPSSARALVNFRIHPRDSVEQILAHARAAIADPAVELAVLGSTEPSPVSPAHGPAYELLERTISQVFPDAAVAPALCIAGTDARHFTGLTPHVYRFLPLRLSPSEAARIHGVGERIALSSYLEMVRFYVQLLANS